MCVREPVAQTSDFGFSRIMSYIRPRGSVEASWTARKEAKRGGKNEIALPEEEVNADSMCRAMFTVDNLDSCDHEKMKSRDGSCGSVYETENKAASSMQGTRRHALFEAAEVGDLRAECNDDVLDMTNAETQVQERLESVLPELAQGQLTKSRRTAPWRKSAWTLTDTVKKAQVPSMNARASDNGINTRELDKEDT